MQKAKADLKHLRNDLASRIDVIDQQLSELLNEYLAKVVDTDSYLRKKEELIHLKTALRHDEKALCRSQAEAWIEPTRESIKALRRFTELDLSTPLDELALLFRKVGSNPIISLRKPLFSYLPPYDFVAQQRAKLPEGGTGGVKTVALQTRQRQFGRQYLDWARTLPCLEGRICLPPKSPE
jgi:hypothetical protein